MLKRLGIGLLKGLLIGAAIGAGLQYGMPWAEFSGLLGFLVAMGVAGTTGVFAGKPPWQQGAWIEATLKGMVGVGLGALVYWVASRWGQFSIPYPGLAEPASWTALPAVFGPVVAGIYGSLVELDNTGDSGKGKEEESKSSSKARVELDEEEELEEPAPKSKKKREA
jgi:hypothetical protein